MTSEEPTVSIESEPSDTEWRRHLAPLGVPTLVIADDPALLEAACATYADWLSEAPTAGGMIELRLEQATGASNSVSDGIAVEGSRLTLSGPGFEGWADAERGRAACRMSPALAGDPAVLAAEIVDPLLLFLLCRTGRIPVHASGVILGETALILAGPSGSGKSTLALAAARRGLPVLSDDTVYVEMEPRLRVWGFPRPIHVFAKDAPDGAFGERLRGGKRKLAVPLDLGCRVSDTSVLIVLQRGDTLGLSAITLEEALDRLSFWDPGFDLLADASASAIRALAGNGAWLLTLSHDPDAALVYLIGEAETWAQRRA
jgi:hypothetical protein